MVSSLQAHPLKGDLLQLILRLLSVSDLCSFRLVNRDLALRAASVIRTIRIAPKKAKKIWMKKEDPLAALRSALRVFVKSDRIVANGLTWTEIVSVLEDDEFVSRKSMLKEIEAQWAPDELCDLREFTSLEILGRRLDLEPRSRYRYSNRQLQFFPTNLKRLEGFGYWGQSVELDHLLPNLEEFIFPLWLKDFEIVEFLQVSNSKHRLFCSSPLRKLRSFEILTASYGVIQLSALCEIMTLT